MKLSKIVAPCLLASTLGLAGCSDDNPAAAGGTPDVVSGAGDVTASVNQFRALLGEPLNGVTVGQQANGRREINWDAVPAAFTNVSTFPADFFNTRSPRGAVFGGSSGFRVSDTGFADLSPSLAGQFRSFSPSKIFAPIGSRTMEVTFQVAGGTQAAQVRGFGVVFADVDRRGSALIEFFGSGGSLGVFEASASAGGLSFIGVVFDQPVVTRVRITSGTAALGEGATESGATDLVAMDDFLYDEPRR